MRTRVILILIVVATLALAQNDSVNIFLPTPYENTIGFAASVLRVCNGRTTYGLRCTTGVLDATNTCDAGSPDFTVTEAAKSYVATRTTQFSSAVMTETETCSLKGTTEASCTVDILISGSGKTTQTSTSSVIGGTDVASYYMFQVPVTAGVQNLHVEGGACSGATKATAPILLGGILGIFVFVAAVVL